MHAPLSLSVADVVPNRSHGVSRCLLISTSNKLDVQAYRKHRSQRLTVRGSYCCWDANNKHLSVHGRRADLSGRLVVVCGRHAAAAASRVERRGGVGCWFSPKLPQFASDLQVSLWHAKQRRRESACIVFGWSKWSDRKIEHHRTTDRLDL